MALTEIMRMSQADLEYLVEQRNGALGSSGTSSGPSCESTSVHCCFAEPSAIKVAVADDGETSSGYKLIAGDCEFAIGLE